MLYEDHSAKLLGLEDIIVKKVWENEGEQHIEIELLCAYSSSPVNHYIFYALT